MLRVSEENSSAKKAGHRSNYQAKPISEDPRGHLEPALRGRTPTAKMTAVHRIGTDPRNVTSGLPMARSSVSKIKARTCKHRVRA